MMRRSSHVHPATISMRGHFFRCYCYSLPTSHLSGGCAFCPASQRYPGALVGSRSPEASPVLAACEARACGLPPALSAESVLRLALPRGSCVGAQHFPVVSGRRRREVCVDGCSQACEEQIGTVTPVGWRRRSCADEPPPLRGRSAAVSRVARCVCLWTLSGRLDSSACVRHLRPFRLGPFACDDKRISHTLCATFPGRASPFPPRAGQQKS